MSNKPNDGGPAYPVNTTQQHGGFEPSTGMSLRDKFADSVLPDVFSEYAKTNMLPLAPDVKASVALECYSMADAMLAAREVKNGQ